MNEYKKEYSDFLKSYVRGTTDAEMVGFLIAKFAGYFAELAAKKVATEIAFNTIAADNERSKDESGKALSSAKARVFSEATNEYSEFLFAKADLDSVQEQINALKSLQRGLSNEYQFSS